MSQQEDIPIRAKLRHGPDYVSCFLRAIENCPNSWTVHWNPLAGVSLASGQYVVFYR